MAKKDAHLPGLAPTVIEPVHQAIEEYVEARDNRMALTKIETEKKATLMGAMKRAEIQDYNVDGHEAHLEVDETVKAKIKIAGGEEAEAES